MKPIRNLLAMAAALLLGASSLPAAPLPTVRYQQPAMHPSYETYGGMESHRSGLHSGQAFDNFVFQRDEKIAAFRWEGLFINEGQTFHTPPPEDAGWWEVSVWEDSDGRPGDLLLSEFRPADQVPRTDVSNVDFGEVGTIQVHRFDFEFSAPLAVSASTSYWISVVYESVNRQPTFYWAFGAGSDAPLPQMSWASILQNADGFLRIDQNDGSEIFWEWAHASMSLLTLPAQDADADGMDDTWETSHALDPATDDASADPDADGSTNFEEFARRTDPHNADTDGDGIPDGAETNTGIYTSPTDTGTSPLLADTDRDGLPDNAEDPTLPSATDQQFPTDPNQLDSDSDGYADQLEIRQNLDPRNAASLPALNILGTGASALLGGGLTEPENGAVSFTSFTLASAPGTPTNLVDNQLGAAGTDWEAKSGDGSGHFPFLYFQAQLDQPVVLTHFTIASSHQNPGADPLAWELQGSNDGETFHTIFHRTSPQSVWSERSQVVRFDAGTHYPTPAAYSFFRFATHNQPGLTESEEAIALGELELFGTPFVEEIIDVPDPVLRAAIYRQLGKPLGEIWWDPPNTLTRAEMESLVELDAGGSSGHHDVFIIESLEGLQAATNLERLYLYRSAPPFIAPPRVVPDLDFSPLRELQNLYLLDLSWNKPLSDPRFPEGFTSLRELNLAWNDVTDFSFLRQFVNLTTLNLSFNGISAFTLPAGLDELTSIDLSPNPLTTLLLPESYRSAIEQGTLTIIQSEDPVEVQYYDESRFPAAPWLIRHGFPYDTDLHQDLNGDGVSLFTAHALNLDPHLNLRNRMPIPVVGDDELSISFHAAAPGITYTVETSTDLRTWTTTGVTLTRPGADRQRTATVTTDAPHRYLRLRISQNP